MQSSWNWCKSIIFFVSKNGKKTGIAHTKSKSNDKPCKAGVEVQLDLIAVDVDVIAAGDNSSKGIGPENL